MKKSASILDYSYPFLDPAIWDQDQKLYSFHKDFILRLLDKMYVNYKLKQPELWITDIRIIGSLTTSKWLFTSDVDVHMMVDLAKFIETNMPGADPKVAFEFLDNTRKEFDRAKILAPMTQHPIEYYFEVPEMVNANTSFVGVYSIPQDKWLKDPVIFEADLDFEESKKQVMSEAEAIAQALDGSFGKIDRQIDRISELEHIISTWGPDKKQLFYNKIEEKLKTIEAEILKDLELRQALIDARHAAQDPMADIEIKFKWLQRFGFFGILSNLKNLMKETGGQVTMQELPLIKKIVTDSSLKEAFLKEAFQKRSKLNQKYWIDPQGKEYPVDQMEGHYKWVATNILKQPWDKSIVDTAVDKTEEMIQQGWTRITTESDYDFAIEVADLNRIPFYVDNFIAQHYTGGGVEIDDQTGEYQDIQDPFPSIQKQVNRARRLRLQPAAKLFSKKDIIAKTKKVKQGEYSCIMAMVPHEIAQEIIEFGVREIPDADLYTDENGNLGRELEAHVTILYGLLTDDAKSIRRSFNDTKPFKAKLGKVRHFQPEDRDFDVITVEVISDDLNAANKMINGKFDCADDLPSSGEYKPHITIAYVKRNSAKKHIGSDEFEGIELELDTLVFSPRKGNKTYFSIGTDKESSFVLEKIDKFASNDIGYWVDPQGTVYDSHGEGLVHAEWIAANAELLTKKYGIKIPDYKAFNEQVDQYFHDIGEGHENMDMPDVGDIWDQMLRSGWTRVGDASGGVELGVEINDLRHVPTYLNSLLVEDLHDGEIVVIEDINHNPVYINYPFKDLQQAVNKALSTPNKTASIEHVETPEGVRIPVLVNPSANELLSLENHAEAHSLRGLVDPNTGDLYAWEAYKSIHNPMIFALGLDMDYNKYSGIASKHILHFAGDSVVRMLDFQKEVREELNTVNASVKQADFLPSLTTQAPDNKWQFAEGGDDKEIAVDPDSVSDETTYDAPCTVGKPRSKEVWRQFISMFSNLFSKNDTQKLEAYDKELEEANKDALGEDETALDYSKGFYDPKKHDFPHNTTWDSLVQDGEPSKPTSVTYSPQISNDDNLDQNSPGGYPRRFMGKPKGEYFSNEGEANNALIQMLRNRTATIEAMTTDITADLSHAYWIDPNGKVFEVRGGNFGKTYTGRDTHEGWIKENLLMLKHDYGIEPHLDGFTEKPVLSTPDLLDKGWIRIGDAYSASWGITVKDLNKIPSSVDNVLAQYATDGDDIEISDRNNQYIEIEWPVKSVQQAVNKARLVQASLNKDAFLEHAYWIDPNGKVFEVRGAGEFDDNDYTHYQWVQDNEEMLAKDYGISDIDPENLVDSLVRNGWTRIGDSVSAEQWQVQVPDLKRIPKAVDNLLAQFAPDGADIDFADQNGNFITLQWPWNNSQAAVNRALRQSLPMAAFLKTALIKQYALYVNNIAYPAVRTLTQEEALNFVKQRFPEAYAKGTYQIKEERMKVSSLNRVAGSQSASVPDYLIDEWKTEQIHNDTDEEPYVNHDQRDYPYGMHDSPENTGQNIGWPKDQQPQVVFLDKLENPAFRNNPFNMTEYWVTYYNSMPMSDGIEKMNPE